MLLGPRPKAHIVSPWTSVRALAGWTKAQPKEYPLRRIAAAQPSACGWCERERLV